jgi:5-methylcytosine-specific restriction protein B
MGLEVLRDIVMRGAEDWKAANEAAFSAMFGSAAGRYKDSAKAVVSLRANPASAESGVPYAGYIHPDNTGSGPYGGMSIAIFPVANARCLVTFVVGTGGLYPDEEILGRPGHARKVQALCAWLNATHGEQVAWAKQDPTRTDEDLPAIVAAQFEKYKTVLKRYGKVLYGIYAPRDDDDEAVVLRALKAFFDLMFIERGETPLTALKPDAKQIESEWVAHLMPSVTEADVVNLLASRRYAIIEGPPGTGKTRMAQRLVRGEYAGNGRTIQFHANTTYENFVGGLAPIQATEGVGLAFSPQLGYLMEAVNVSNADPLRPYLLHIDEINRADLGKVLGEAIYLLEPNAERTESRRRSVELPYDFGGDIGRSLSLPPNLHILGTMNTADRSLGAFDVAVRRRFAFVTLWPQASVVAAQGNEFLSEAFEKLLMIFIDHARDDAFGLVPGHSYFLVDPDTDPIAQLKATLVPLLREYLAQGYVGGFAEQIRAYLQWIDSRSSEALHGAV